METSIVEKILNGNTTDYSALNDYSKRLIKAWELYNNDEKYIFDFEIILRDYLLFNQEHINIFGYVISEKGLKIGLRQKGSLIWVEEQYPNYITHKSFIKNVYNKKKMNLDLNNYQKLECPNYIKKLTGFDFFKSEEQKLTVIGCLNSPKGFTTLVSMSTGAGKSLITQTISFQEDGLTIVIVPTISLMLDQEKNAKEILKNHSNEIFHYHGSMDISEITKKIENHQCKLLFISPESLIKNALLKKMIIKINNEGILKNLIIDEAHIIFEWGDSFRLDFQCLDIFKKDLLSNNPNLRTFLLSATYSEEDVQNLKKLYSNGDDWIELRSDSLRKEIHYEFIKAKDDFDKINKLLEIVEIIPHPMIIYVSSPDEAKAVKKKLEKNCICNTEMYTGETNSNDREKLLIRWKNNDFSIMIATCAFGVGVDKKDVKSVIHFYLPDNINKFYQEAGRGGRDGNACLSYIIYDENDCKSIYSKVKSSVLTTEKLSKRWFSMLNSLKSQKKNNNRVLIDTSVIPSYDTDEEKIFVNKADINWNVYVLLFLKRHGLIKIEDIIFNGKNYEMLIHCLNLNLYIDDETINSILEEEREKEWANVEKKCKKMLQMIKSSESICVAESFIDVYEKIPSIYCSGCNAHANISKDLSNDLPLVSVNPQVHYFINMNVGSNFIETNNIQATLNEIIDDDFLSVISSKKYSVNGLNTYLYDYKEYIKLSKSNKFLFGKSIIFIADSEINNFLVFSKYIKDTINDKNINVFIICEKDVYIENKQKYLYELFDCVKTVKLFDSEVNYV